MQASTPAPSVIRSPSKPRKSPKTASKADTTSGSAPIESQSSARPGPFVSPSSSISGSVGRISQTGSASQNASGSQPQNGSMNSMMSPLMFSSSAATLSHMQQLRLRQHSKTMLLRRLEDGADLCSYTHRVCLQNKLEGFDHCIRHILYDKNNTFRQCSFVHPQSHKRCPNAARKTERKEAICPWHFKKFFLKRKQAVSRPSLVSLVNLSGLILD